MYNFNIKKKNYLIKCNSSLFLAKRFQHFFDLGGKISKAWLSKIQHRLLLMVRLLKNDDSNMTGC